MADLVVFRVDGGKVWSISMGHILRSTIIAQRMKRKYRILFLMKKYPAGVDYVRNQGFETRVLSQLENEEDEVIKVLSEIKPAIAISDLIQAPSNEILAFARDNNIKTVVLDTLGNCQGFPDLVINDSLVPDYLEYESLDNMTQKFLGPEYLVLPEQIPAKEINRNAEKILLTFGGSDPAGLTLKALTAIKRLESDVKINVVLGPVYSEKKKILKITESIPNVEIIHNPNNILSLLSEQDIVISASGRTVYECAFLGRPVIMIPSIEHELAVAREMNRLCGYINLDLWNDSTGQHLCKAVNDLIQDYAQRLQMHQKAREIFDGKGLERVIDVINRM